MTRVEAKVACLDLPRVANQPAAADPTERLAGLEWARLIACIGIVWFHAKAPGARIGYGGLVTMMAISVALAARSGSRRTPGQVIKNRLRRLMRPWLFWSAVYGIVSATVILTGLHPLHERFHGWMLLTGPSLHLWYLPYAFVATCLAALVARWLDSTHLLPTVTWLILPIASIPLCAWLLTRISDVTPLGQWAFACPAVFMGFAVGRAPTQPVPHRIYLIGLFSSIATGCLVAWALGWNQMATPMLSGSIGLILASMLRTSAGPLLAWLSGLSFGVYLVHPLFALAILKSDLDQHRLVAAAVISILSMAASVVLRRTPLRDFT